MRVAFVGKGGSGKSTLAGTMCRVLAERGEQVLALDADQVPGLAYTLGVQTDDEWPLSSGAVFVPKKGWELVITPREAVEYFSKAGPPGIRFLQFGKMTGRMTRQQQASAVVFLKVIKEFDREGWSQVIDLAAGPRQAYFGWIGGAKTILAVVEPSFKSLLTIRRMVKLRDRRKKIEILGIANKVASPHHRRLIQTELDKLKIAYWGEVPADEELAEAEKHGLSPFEEARSSKAVKAIEQITRRLIRMHEPAPRASARASR